MRKKLIALLTALAMFSGYSMPVLADNETAEDQSVYEYEDRAEADEDSAEDLLSTVNDDTESEETTGTVSIDDDIDLITDDAEFGATIASGNCGAQGDNVRWTLDSEGTLIIIGSGAMADYDMEKYIESGKYSAYRSLSPFRVYVDKIKRVEIKKGVTHVGDYSFIVGYNNNNGSISYDTYNIRQCLESVVCSDTVVSIGKSAFEGCISLKSITLPEKMELINYKCFRGCENVEHIKMPNEIERINDEAFYKCGKTDCIINFPQKISHIGTWALRDTYGISEITLSNDIEYVGAAAFDSCHDLTKIIIEDDIGTVREGVFGNCDKLVNIQLPNIWAIPNNTFSGCTSLTSVIIPEGITEIGKAAFSGCTSLTDISIPSTIPLSKINSTAFRDCSLTHIHIPYGTTYLDYACRGDLPVEEEYYFPQHRDGGCKDPACPFDLYVPTVDVESIELDSTSVSLDINQQVTLTATIMPENATDKTITWISSDENIAVVSASGTVTGLSIGSATITVAASNGKTITCIVTVQDSEIEISGITLDKTDITIETGQTEKLTATLMPENATNKVVTWVSNNATVASISSDGIVTANAVGTATITATTSNGLTASCTVTVIDYETAAPAKPTVTINAAFGGRTVQLNCADEDAEIYYNFGSSNITTDCKHVKAGETIFLNEPMTGNKAAMYFKAYRNGKWSPLGKWGVLNVQIAKPLIVQSVAKSANNFKVYTQTKDSYIVYTLDGSTPAINEGTNRPTVKNGKLIWSTSAVINVPKGKTVKAIAVRCGLVTSDVMTYTNN